MGLRHLKTLYLCGLITFSFRCIALLAADTNAKTNSEIEKVFNSLKKQAAKLSPEIQAAKAQVAQKEAQIYTSWARWIPRIDLQLSQTSSKDFSLLTSGSLGNLPFSFTPTEVQLSRWNLNLTLPLYKRSVHLAVNQSNAESLASDQQLKMKNSELDWRMRSLFGDYLLKKYKSSILENSIQAARTNLKETKLRIELGSRTKLDELRAEANLASLESKKLSLEQDESTSLNALLEYSGINRKEFFTSELNEILKSEELITLAIEGFTQAYTPNSPLSEILNNESLLETRFVNSPTYQSTLLEQKVSDVRSQTLMAQEWPELDLQASLNKQGPDWGNAVSAGNQSHSLTIMLTIPIFSGGSTLSTYFEKRHSEEANLIQREKSLLQLKDEIENEFIQIKALQKTIQSQRVALNQNEELVRLSKRSYQLGKTTQLELLTSENDLLESKSALAQTRINLATLLRRFTWNLGMNLGIDL